MICSGVSTSVVNIKSFSITFENEVQDGINALLVSLEGDDIIIITALEGVQRHNNDVFAGCEHIYLTEYTFHRPTYNERRINKMRIKEVRPEKTHSLKIIKKKNSKRIKGNIITSTSSERDDIELFMNSMKNTKRL